MYESPIKVIQGELETQLEGEILKAVHRVGVSVDRDELIRALRYEREQYQKGFDDARAAAVVVTRCKDCEHLVNATVNGNGFLICDISDMETAPDDFCSHGDRREEAGP